MTHVHRWTSVTTYQGSYIRYSISPLTRLETSRLRTGWPQNHPQKIKQPVSTHSGALNKTTGHSVKTSNLNKRQYEGITSKQYSWALQRCKGPKCRWIPLKLYIRFFNPNDLRSAILFVPNQWRKRRGSQGSVHSTSLAQKVITHIQLGKYQAQSPALAINNDCIHSHSSSLPSYIACYGS